MEIVFSLAWGALLPGGIVERIAITPRIAIGAVLVVAGALAEIFIMGGKRKEAQAGQSAPSAVSSCFWPCISSWPSPSRR
jgi:hypothetical protein